ncbi:MAG: DUF5655 domain-containing protein [Rufibacter sp.]
MWICPDCQQEFLRTNQSHSCLDRTVEDFLRGKSEHTLGLYHHFLAQYRTIGDFKLHPTKSMISLARNTRFCSIIRLGKNFIDVVLPYDRLFPEDNLCFHKMGPLPGAHSYNHHCRLYEKEDVNEELLGYMRLVYERDAGLAQKAPRPVASSVEKPTTETPA